MKYGNSIDWYDEKVSDKNREDGVGIMYYEDDKAMARILKAYNDENSFMEDSGDYADTIPITEDEVINNVVSQLSKMQTEIIDGDLVVLSLDGEDVLIEDGVFGTEFGELTKSDILSRMTAVKYLSNVIYKCMHIVETEDFVEIYSICQDIKQFQNDLEDGENNTVVNQMVSDLKEIM